MLVSTLDTFAERVFDVGGWDGEDGMVTSCCCLFWGGTLCLDRVPFCTTFPLLLAAYLFLITYIRAISPSFRKYRWWNLQQATCG